MKRVFLCTALLVAMPAIVGAAEVGTYGTTLLRVEERDAPGVSKESHVPLTQYLGIDATSLGDGNLSLHLYGWGRYDFADTSADDKRENTELTYGYLRYRFPKSDAEIRAGRFFVNEGVAHEHLDGVFARADLAYGFTASVFGGAPVRFNHDNRGDYLVGSRVAYRLPGVFELGGSTVFEKGATSTKYSSTASSPVSTVGPDRQLTGGDVWIALGTFGELTGSTSYNVSTSSFAEHNYLLQVRPVKQVTVAGFYTERQFKGYFAGTNLPLLFRPDNLDDSTQYGGSVTWQVAEPVDLVADYRHIRRDSVGDTNRYGIETRIALKQIYSRVGFGYHRYDAPDISTPASLSPSNYSLSFHQVRGWMMYDRNKCLFSVDMIGNFYDDSDNPNLNGKGSDFEVVASAGYRLLKDLTVSGDLSYGENALHKEEFRAVARLEFAFNFGDKGNKK